MRGSPIKPFLTRARLRFADPGTEAAFLAAYPAGARQQLRLAFFLATLMGLIYLPQDSVIAPEYGYIATYIRLLAILPLGLLGFALTFGRALDRWSQAYTAAIFTGLLLALLALLLVLDNDAGYGISSSTGLSNVTLAIIFIFAVSTLRFFAAASVAIILVAVYYYLVTRFTLVDYEYFVSGDFSNVVFILLIGGFIGAGREIYQRNDFQAQLRLEERFRGLVEGSIQGILVHQNHRPLFANQAFADILGFENVGQILALDTVLALYGETSGRILADNDRSLMAGARPRGHFEIAARRQNGDEIWLDCLTSLVHWGEAPAVQHTVIDISQRRLAEAERSRLSQAVEQSPVGVLILDAAGIVEYANQNYLTSTGYEAADVVGQNLRAAKLAEMSEAEYQAVMSTITGGSLWEGEVHSTRSGGEGYWEHLVISPIRTDAGEITHFMLSSQDISIRKVYEERLLHQAHYDHLTDLPNRLLALDRLSGAIARARRARDLVAVMFIDLDSFKKVNDMMGHNAGDRLLKDAARRLKSCGRDGDTMARLGGDEFAAILPDLKSSRDAELLARRIVEAFAEPFTIDDREIYATASVGISVYPNDGVDPVFLMRNADTAMYDAKKAGRNTYHFFTEAMNDHIQERIRLETRLRHALQRDELSVYFQPLVTVSDGSITSAEALLRWHNGELGEISPGQFIPLAEDTGLIVPIGYWVLESACAWIRQWHDQALGPRSVAVNVSTRQFMDEHFVENVLEIVARYRLPPGSLELEVTESLLLEEDSEALKALEKLKAAGIGLSIDDFGTGYSSLSYLKRYPFDTLKIDSSFVRDMVNDPEDRVLIQAMVAMAHSLSLKVIAEGVETEEQLRLLRDLACDIVQGYYFGHAMSPAHFQELIDQDERRKLVVV